MAASRYRCERIAKASRSAYQFRVVEELISDPKGFRLSVERSVQNGVIQLDFKLQGKAAFLLHWGVARIKSGQWEMPDQSLWPTGSKPHGSSAVQSPFEPGAEGQRLTLRIPEKVALPFLVFDLFSPETGRWENNRGRDYWITLTEPGPSPMAALQAQQGGESSIEAKQWLLDGGGELATSVEHSGNAVHVTLVTDLAGELFLHWGLQQKSRATWSKPDASLFPDGTSDFDDMAVRTPFHEHDRLNWLKLSFPLESNVPGIGFLLFQPATGRWIKHRGADLLLKLSRKATDAASLTELMERIVDGEMGLHGWTLMHRFNLCHDLIDDAGGDRDAWATLFVWLRYSSIRQLDWQRNYNTKPRELSHSQDRLTVKLAESYVRHPAQRDLIRLMVGCVGRGGDGQRIRDEILHIMHRHHIKEVGGTWMEQWHQKLHNNTTPDDIVICEAYLAFLRGDGNLEAYSLKLGEGGVTRERLAGFERPITRNPEWHPHLKDGLIHDFEDYLQLLRSVHSGTDLETAGNSGGHLLDDSGRDALGSIGWHFGNPDTDVVELTGRITDVRGQLNRVLASEPNAGRVKDGLYLDLALEEALRTVIERRLHSGLDGGTLLKLAGQVQSNLLFVSGDPELDQCARELARLPVENRFSPDWSLRAKAVLDRLTRAVEAITDSTYQLLQPRAEQLGQAFEADDWTVRLFSEEIVRGRPVFVLSMLLHQLNPILRKSAQLGDWQVISPNQASGSVLVVDELRSVQGRRLDRPTVIVAERVFGDEEPPDGVRAVITPQSVDLVSHVAVRARNASLLFAACFDPETFARLKRLNGKAVELTVSGAGDVIFKASSEIDRTTKADRQVGQPQIKLPEPTLRVLQRHEFERGLVGGKAWRIRELSERLAGRFETPRSIALPFGVFDAVITRPENRENAQRFKSLLKRCSASPEKTLRLMRDCVLDLKLPEELLAQVGEGLKSAGLLVPGDMDAAATRIKQVWASLWNARAYFSRESYGLPHDRVSMSVLVQQVVEAEYAFVVHTINPATGNPDEIYTEVVQGLGETLVGNYPGRAMSFTSRKSGLNSTVVAYPSKSVALRGGGLIFRSDSNVEDLEGYAGAGLYDSVLLEPAREERTDYTEDPLVWDAMFQQKLFHGVAQLGCEVEEAFNGPQDIEGVWAKGKFHVVQTRPQVGSK